MRKMTGTINITKEVEIQKTGGMMITTAKDVFRKGEKKTIWINVFLTKDQKEKYLKVSNRKSLEVVGDFSVKITEAKGKSYLNISVFPDYIAASQLRTQSQLIDVKVDGVRLGSDLKEHKEMSFVNGVIAGTKEEPTWGNLIMSPAMTQKAKKMSIKKGSKIDIIASFDAYLEEYEEKTYLRIVLPIYNMSFSTVVPNDGTAKTDGTPAPEQQTPVPEPQTAPEQQTAPEPEYADYDVDMFFN